MTEEGKVGWKEGEVVRKKGRGGARAGRRKLRLYGVENLFNGTRGAKGGRE